MSEDKVDKSLGAKRLEKHLKDEVKKGKKMSEILGKQKKKRKNQSENHEVWSTNN